MVDEKRVLRDVSFSPRPVVSVQPLSLDVLAVEVEVGLGPGPGPGPMVER